MTVTEARLHLKRPLVFGDRDQIKAREVLQELAEALSFGISVGMEPEDEIVARWLLYKHVLNQ
jgi:hypothetical protein